MYNHGGGIAGTCGQQSSGGSGRSESGAPLNRRCWHRCTVNTRLSVRPGTAPRRIQTQDKLYIDYRPHHSTTHVDAAYCYRRIVVCLSVGPSVGLSVTIVSPKKTAELIGMPFGMGVSVRPSKHALYRGAYWRHLANTIEPPMCGDDASALMPHYFDHLSTGLWPRAGKL